jgi:hypothetical protein
MFSLLNFKKSSKLPLDKYFFLKSTKSSIDLIPILAKSSNFFILSQSFLIISGFNASSKLSKYFTKSAEDLTKGAISSKELSHSFAYSSIVLIFLLFAELSKSLRSSRLLTHIFAIFLPHTNHASTIFATLFIVLRIASLFATKERGSAVNTALILPKSHVLGKKGATVITVNMIALPVLYPSPEVILDHWVPSSFTSILGKKFSHRGLRQDAIPINVFTGSSRSCANISGIVHNSSNTPLRR